MVPITKMNLENELMDLNYKWREVLAKIDDPNIPEEERNRAREESNKIRLEMRETLHHLNEYEVK
jgi:hypothetical protein